MIPLKLSRIGALPRLPAHRLEAVLLRHGQLLLLLLAALLQGTIYLLLVPPWQHYDEPTHFEYAWLIANRGRLPEQNEVDTVMRREVAASMMRHDFFRDLPPPDLLAEGHDIFIGISELGHPPAFYLLVSGPLWIARYLDVTTQLYVARSVALLLFVLTIAWAWAAMRELTTDGNQLRWAVPLGIVLLPPFADLMTAVNNDVGAICVFTLFLALALRTIRRGLHWRRLGLLTATALLAVATKNTASVALVLLPLVVLLALAAARGWSWRWLVGLTGAAVFVAGVAVLGWGDPAFWYRDSSAQTQPAPARVATAQAPLGDHAIMIEAVPEHSRYLVNPLVMPEAERLAGTTVTVGAWVWSDQASSARLSLLHSPPDLVATELAGMTITTTSSPMFVSWTAKVPHNTQQLLFALAHEPPPETTAPRVMLDGALVVEGAFTHGQPTFDDASGQSGQWNGQSFHNVLRNGSGEQAWPRLRSWLDATLARYARRSPTQVIAAIFDVQRTWPPLATVTLGEVLFTFFSTTGWGHINLARPFWQPVTVGIVCVAALGCLRWLLGASRRVSSTRKAQLTLLGIAGFLVWINVVLRVLPLLDDVPIYAIARYGFPAIFPAMLALVGGWQALWPRRLRVVAPPSLIAALLVVNGWSQWIIWSYYQVTA